MMNIAFGQSKYYIDNLSENIKRGHRAKLRKGIWPNFAPLGYSNNPKTRAIDIDSEKAPFIRKAFELYATGEYTLKALAKVLDQAGLRSYKGNVLSVSCVQRLLQNPIYYGVFYFNGEIYDGTHEPIISKKVFVQNLQAKKTEIEAKAENLLDLFIGGKGIEPEEYQAKKSKLLNEKLDIQQKIKDFEQKGNNWLEPMKEMILANSQAKIILSQSDNQEIRAFLKNIGSNFILKDKKFQFALKICWRALAEGEPTKTFPNWRRGWDSNPRSRNKPE